MALSVRIKKRPISTDLIPDPATKDVVDALKKQLDTLIASQARVPYFSSTIKSFFTTVTTATIIPAFSFAMPTYGNPVEISIQSVPDLYGSQISLATTPVGAISGFIGFLRDGILFGEHRFDGPDPGTWGYPPSIVRAIDSDVPAGVHTYQIRCYVPVGSITFGFVNVRAMGVEF